MVSGRRRIMACLLAAIALHAAVAAPAPAPACPQSGCVDPAPGSVVIVHRDVLVTFSDGYRTLMDVYLPAAAPGSCGWPAIAIIHSNFSSKGQMEYLARNQARRGYAALTFDARGQGPSMQLNDPSRYGRGDLGFRERLDLFEIFEAAGASFPQEIDLGRLGVAGPTQGGFYSWAAAAHSGKLPPPNPWRTARLPRIAAVAAHDFSADLWEWMLPAGQAATEMLAFNLYSGNPGLHNDPAFVAQVEPFLLAEDYAGLRALLDRPELHLPTLLQSSDVPILASLSYDDMFGSPNSTLAAWNSFCPGVPKLLDLTTGGHSSPLNERELELRNVRRALWFDRFLKGVPNGIEHAPGLRLAVVPEGPREPLDPDSLWDAYEFAAWPPAPAVIERWYLAPGAALSRGPAGAAGEDLLDHRPASGYGIADYLAELPSPECLQQRIPLAAVHYDSAPLSRDLVLAGISQAILYVRCNDPAYQLQAALFDLGPDGSRRYVTAGFTTVRGNLGGTRELRVALSAYGYCLRAGHRLRLQVEDLVWHRPPLVGDGGGLSRLPTYLRALPVFEPFVAGVRRSSLETSRLELSTVASGQPRLQLSRAVVDDTAPVDVGLRVYSDSSTAGRGYQILMGVSGTAPPTAFGGVLVPLVFDRLTLGCLNSPRTPPFAGFAGWLDQGGRGRARFLASMFARLPPALSAVDVVALVEDGAGAALLTTSARLRVE